VFWGNIHLAVLLANGLRRAFAGLMADVIGPAALVIAATVAASGQSGPGFAGNVDPLFEGMLNRPTDINNAIQYATSSAASGDIESAISTYEQLRYYNPKVAATRFQLGVLYYQLGSYDEARGYLETALQMPDITPDLAAQAQALLEIIDKKLQVDQFTGFAQTGLRYQTNASLGPSIPSGSASARPANASRFARPVDAG
jgi:tetratricopeptide (TPR) repeat protein